MYPLQGKTLNKEHIEEDNQEHWFVIHRTWIERFVYLITFYKLKAYPRNKQDEPIRWVEVPFEENTMPKPKDNKVYVVGMSRFQLNRNDEIIIPSKKDVLEKEFSVKWKARDFAYALFCEYKGITFKSLHVVNENQRQAALRRTEIIKMKKEVKEIKNKIIVSRNIIRIKLQEGGE